MVLGLFYLEQGTVFQHLDYAWSCGSLLILAGLSVAGAAAIFSSGFSADGQLSVEILGLVIIWMGSFLLCYGSEAARTGLFVLLFSLLLVPLPESVIAKPIALIQHASANVTSFLFILTGVPAFREGLTFSLPRLSFVVGTECSGIHSSIALFISSILVGHFYFSSWWKRVLLVLLVLPIISFTNGLRMFVLATLAVYVDMGFFYGNLHHRGGSLFFALALGILAGAAKLLGGRWRLTRLTSPAKVETVRA
jgi:exosortase